MAGSPWMVGSQRRTEQYSDKTGYFLLIHPKKGIFFKKN